MQPRSQFIPSSSPVFTDVALAHPLPGVPRGSIPVHADQIDQESLSMDNGSESDLLLMQTADEK